MATYTDKLKVIIGADDRATPKLNKVAKAAAGVFAAYMSWNLLKGTFNWITEAGMQHEQTWNDVASALKRHGHEVEGNLEKVQIFSDEMQTLTGVSDEVIGKGIQGFIDYGNSIEKSMDLMKVAADLAAGSGMDLRAAVELLEKASVGYTGTLSRYGIIIDESIPKSQKFAMAIDQINQRFGGAAAARANDMTTRMALMSQKVGDLGEKLFYVFSPALLDAIDAAIGALDAFMSVIDFLFPKSKELTDQQDEMRKIFADLYPEIDITIESMKGFEKVITNVNRILTDEELAIALQELANRMGGIPPPESRINLETWADDIAKVGDEAEEAAASIGAHGPEVTAMVEEMVMEIDEYAEWLHWNNVRRLESRLEAERTSVAERRELELSLIQQQEEWAIEQSAQIQQQLNDWSLVISSAENFGHTMLEGVMMPGKITHDTFQQLGRQIVHTFAGAAFRALVKYIATEFILTKTMTAKTAIMKKDIAVVAGSAAATSATAAATSSLAGATVIATAAMTAEMAVVKTLTASYISLAAAKAAVTMGLSTGPSIAAAAATKAALTEMLMGFDDRINDALAMKHGRDYADYFMIGAKQRLSSPTFGLDVTGAISQSTRFPRTEAAPTESVIHLHFYGPVTNEQFVQDTIAPAIEEATKHKASKIVIETDDMTGGPAVVI